MSRRSLLRSVFAGAVAATTLGTATAAAAPTSGSTTVQTWTWTRLPGTSLEVHCTAPGGVTAMTVRWTAAGEVTATCPVTLTATAGSVAMAGVAVTVRRAG